VREWVSACVCVRVGVRACVKYVCVFLLGVCVGRYVFVCELLHGCL
jgi:hypothetical protein